MSESTDKSLYYRPKLGFDFYISPKHYLGVEWSGNYSKDYANACWVHSTITDNSPYQTSIRSYAPYTLKPNTNNVTLNYEWKTDTLGSKLNLILIFVQIMFSFSYIISKKVQVYCPVYLFSIHNLK